MATGRRCTICGITFPDQLLYARCPRCGQLTERGRGLDPMSEDDAASILLHEEFEEYYARREARRCRDQAAFGDSAVDSNAV